MNSLHLQETNQPTEKILLNQCGINSPHVQETNQPTEKKKILLNQCILEAIACFEKKEQFSSQAHPLLDNPAVKDTAAWLMHCLQSCHHRKPFENP